MSWFEYGTLPPKKRKLRKGVWLRVRSLPKSLLAVAKKNRRSALETLDWVIVKEMRPDGKVLLEFWGHTPLLDEFGKRYTVFYHLCDEDPTWICEGDLGRGYKE